MIDDDENDGFDLDGPENGGEDEASSDEGFDLGGGEDSLSFDADDESPLEADAAADDLSLDGEADTSFDGVSDDTSNDDDGFGLADSDGGDLEDGPTLADALGSATNVDLSKSLLDQNEIDRLMNENDDRVVSAQNVMELIANSTIVNYERLPMLDVVFDRFVRLLADNLRHFMSASVEVSIDYVESVRFGDFWVNIPIPSVITVMEVAEWQGNCLTVIDQKLVYTIIENLLGGRDSPFEEASEVRPLTSVERKIAHRVMGIFTRHLSEAFEPLCKATFEIDRLETNPQLAQIARDTNAAVHARFSLEVEGRLGAIDFVLPYSTLEPVRGLLLQMFMGENFGKDSSWEHHFSDKLQNTSVNMQAVLHETQSTLKETLGWEVGTTLNFEATPNDPVRMLCADMELVTGSLGQSKGNIAIRINDTVFDRQEESDEHTAPA